jgi:hypothetical protein
MAAPPPKMPPRGHSTAPKFDPTTPRELRRYFSDLKLLLTNCSIVDDAEKKKHAIRYLDIDTSDLWENLPQYSAGAFNLIKTAVHQLYPGSEQERKWLVSDMETLISKQKIDGIHDLQDLGNYYRQFLAITQFLCNKSCLSETERCRAFVRGFQPTLWARIHDRLQLKYPDHYPDNPYPLEHVNSAAKFVLHGVSPGNYAGAAASKVSSSTIKAEDLTTFLDKFAQTLVQALCPGQPSTTPSSNPRPEVPGIRPSHTNCNFCGITGHFLSSCQVCEQYIHEGKCHQSPENHIILPGGGSIPRNIQGEWIKDRLDEYHRCNPGQTAVGQLSSNTNSFLMYNIVPQPSPTPGIINMTRIPATFHLNVDDRIAALECEILTLKSCKLFDGVEITKRPRGPDNRPHQPRNDAPRPPPPTKSDSCSSTSADDSTQQYKPDFERRRTDQQSPSPPLRKSSRTQLPPSPRT